MIRHSSPMMPHRRASSSQPATLPSSPTSSGPARASSYGSRPGVPIQAPGASPGFPYKPRARARGFHTVPRLAPGASMPLNRFRFPYKPRARRGVFDDSGTSTPSERSSPRAFEPYSTTRSTGRLSGSVRRGHTPRARDAFAPRARRVVARPLPGAACFRRPTRGHSEFDCVNRHRMRRCCRLGEILGTSPGRPRWRRPGMASPA